MLKFGNPEGFKSNFGRDYSKRVLNLESLQNDFKYLNALTTDEKEFLMIGTEGGYIYVFSLKDNAMVGTIKTDIWTCSLQLANGLLFAVGATRSILCYSMRSFNKILEFKQITDINAYGPKGVKLFNTAINDKLIANVGYGKFKIFNTK